MNNIPKVITCLILSFCSLKDIYSLILTSKEFKKIVESQNFIRLFLDNYAEEISKKYNFLKENYYKGSFYKKNDLKTMLLARIKNNSSKLCYKENFIINKSIIDIFYTKNLGLSSLNIEKYTERIHLINFKNSYNISVLTDNIISLFIFPKKEFSLNEIVKIALNSCKKRIKNKSYYFVEKNTFLNKKKSIDHKFNESVQYHYSDKFKSKNFLFFKNGSYVLSYKSKNNKKDITKIIDKDKTYFSFSKKGFYIEINDNKVILKKKNKTIFILPSFVLFIEKIKENENNFFLSKNNCLIKGKAFKKDNEIFYENLKYFIFQKETQLMLNIKEKGINWFNIEEIIITIDYFF